jgi:endonuclease YncB( thermonuclease family)
MRSTPWSRRRRPRSPLGAIVTLVAIVAIAAIVSWLQPGETLTGRASAVDGDTLRIGQTRIRLIGIDAVELKQECTDASGRAWPCGTEARAHLQRLLSAETRCTADGRDRYGRTLARCAVGGRDLGREMAVAGWALGEIEYALAVAEARGAKRGIWSGGFADPADWRRDNGAENFSLWDWVLSWFG